MSKKTPKDILDPQLEAAQAVRFAETQEDLLTSEEAVAKIGMGLMETKDHQILTEIRPIEVPLISSLKTIFDHYKVPHGMEFVKNFERTRVSQDRAGRKELMEIARAGKEDLDAKQKIKKILTLGRL